MWQIIPWVNNTTAERYFCLIWPYSVFFSFNQSIDQSINQSINQSIRSYLELPKWQCHCEVHWRVLQYREKSPVSTIPELTARVNGYWRVLTGNGNRSPVNSDSGNRAKNCLNRWVFSRCRNDRIFDADVTSSSSEFQICEAATGNARLPTVDSSTTSPTAFLLSFSGILSAIFLSSETKSC